MAGLRAAFNTAENFLILLQRTQLQNCTRATLSVGHSSALSDAVQALFFESMLGC
jgi:hypothetical protein